MESNEKISKALSTSYKSDVEKVKKEVKDIKLSDDKTENDFNITRKNLKELIDRGSEAIDGILKIASEGDQPRATKRWQTWIKLK